MKSQTLPFAVAALLSSSALVAPALAQNQAGSQDPAETQVTCEDAGAFLEENADEFDETYREQAQERLAQGDAEACVALFQEMRTSVQGAEGEVAVDAEIVVSQPSPNVQVQQGSPEVQVTQPDPNVTVDQGQPQVIVRQQPPQVTVEVPQPRVTIDMPQPEIIIRMPDPNVSVDQAQPQVEVRQPQPQVTVDQPEPQIRVEENAELSENQEAQVTVQQDEAQVILEDDGQSQPNVEIQGGEPQVQFEAAEPEVTIENVGEPEIQFNQSGEPQVRFESGGEAAAGEQPEADPEAEGEQPEPEQNAGAEGEQPEPEQSADAEGGVAALIRISDEGADMSGEPAQYRLDDLAGQTLVNARGDESGTIESVVRSGDVFFVVLSADSPLSSGDSSVVLPMENVIVVEGAPVFRGLTDAEMDQLAQFESGSAETVQPDIELIIETEAAQ